MATPAAHWQRKTHSTVCPWIVADGAQKVIDFMTEVLNAKALLNMRSEDNKSVVPARFDEGR